MKPKSSITLLAALALLAGCAMSTLQTAQTIPSGSGVAVGAVLGIADTSQPGNYSGAVPQVILRMGLDDSMDMGFQLFGFGIYIDLKQALYQDRGAGTAVSLIGGAGIARMGSMVATIDVGAIASTRLGRLLSPYAALRFRYLGVGALDPDDKFANTFGGTFLVATAGLVLFPRAPFSLVGEVSRFGALRSGKPSLLVVSAGAQVGF